MKTQLNSDRKLVITYKRDACAREHLIPTRKKKKNVFFKSEITRAVISIIAFQLNCKKFKNEISECIIYEIKLWISRKKIDLKLFENTEELQKTIQRKLLAYLSEYINVFSKADLNKLSPHRPKINHKIELIKKKELRYHSLYS